MGKIFDILGLIVIMSWYKKDNPNIIEIKDQTPKKNYIQVPSSSPILINSSPQKSLPPVMPPSINNPAMDAAKQKALEAKRQAIRQHKDFDMVRKRFYYLEESDIFKGFVKGKGNLREITQWLSDNHNKGDILAKEENEKRQQQKELELIRQKQTEERMRIAYEEREAKLRQQQLEEEQNKDKSTDYDDEDVSPIKVRGKARVKSIGSPIKEQPASQELPSTKVEVKKAKVSILDKYKFKPKSQFTLDHFRPDEQVKKRKLVRGSNGGGMDAPIPMSAMAANFSFHESKFPKVKKQTEDDMIVSDDDLEKLEEKIKQNRKANRSKKHTPMSDDELEDDDVSDGMSEEDDESNFQTGITSIDSQILEFINNASALDMIEICGIEPAIAELVISKRPFNTIFEISENHFELPDEKSTISRKRKTLGLRIIENTEFSLKGYKAVDSLIKTCSQYGDSISNQMKEWGVKVTGEGELDVVDLDPVNEEIEVVDLDDDEEDGDVIVTHQKKKGLKYIKHKPSLLSEEITLNNYQQVGINWLNLLYQNKLSCILADEMGLGKTCQVIAFMAHLKQNEKSNGPHLVIVPASTIENWLREFHKFCPDIIVQAYYGSVRDREDLRYQLKDQEFDVLVTTYSLASGSSIDFKFLKNQNFNIIVYDEGHFLKNSGTERYTRLMKLKAKFRLLLTGTPLQNNLKELVSLLAFMLPKLFDDKREDLQGLFNQKMGTVTSSSSSTPTSYNPLLSSQAISKAKTMMTPFVLRRKKDQVLQHLPAKCHEIIKCDLNEIQHKIYHDHLETARATRIERERRKLLTNKQQMEEAKKSPIPSSTNVLMSLRKASLHPLLFRINYTDNKLKKMAEAIMNEPEYVEANQTFIFEDMQVMSDFELNNLCEKFSISLGEYKLKDDAFLASGKITEMHKLLLEIIGKRKEKVLVFSLFTQVLDVLERVLSLWNYKFVRLDGATSVETRQDIIDHFYEDETIPIFLLSTKAGGFGINLVAANNVIVFDQSFNPHDDKQAEDRAHRVGQKKEVTVYKLIVNKTIEENILQLAENKLELDQSISNNPDGVTDSKFEEKTASLFERLLF
jgi:SWI/SNF-related matrix-associated actin-dependent regulator 1 of chromatin subfamily A